MVRQGHRHRHLELPTRKDMEHDDSVIRDVHEEGISFLEDSLPINAFPRGSSRKIEENIQLHVQLHTNSEKPTNSYINCYFKLVNKIVQLQVFKPFSMIYKMSTKLCNIFISSLTSKQHSMSEWEFHYVP